MTTTPLPPVQRAAAALTKAVADDLWATSSTGDVYDVVVKCENESWRENAERIGAIAAENIRPALAAALDAQEMALLLRPHLNFYFDGTTYRCECQSALGWKATEVHSRFTVHLAVAVRTAILGVDQ